MKAFKNYMAAFMNNVTEPDNEKDMKLTTEESEVTHSSLDSVKVKNATPEKSKGDS